MSTRHLTSLLCGLLLLFSSAVWAKSKVVNVYGWTNEMPEKVLRQFEKETGIKVNFSSYANNEVMYAKLRSSKNPGYDVIMPSSYFVDRMRRLSLLEKLDKSKLPNWKNIDPAFLNPSYDPGMQYSAPHVWGITGIVYNTRYYAANAITAWSDLWEDRFYDQLMLLDDMREVFSMALLSLHYSANDNNPQHIKEAFLKLKTLMKNVKVFSAETVASILIDEDATVGMAWNGDAYKASIENPAIRYIFPKEGFVIWVDNFSIPTNAPHKDTAYTFINFMLRADVAQTVALASHFPTTNLAARKLLPQSVQNDPTIYPSKAVLKRGQFQTDLSEDTLALYEKYWEELKMSG